MRRSSGGPSSGPKQKYPPSPPGVACRRHEKHRTLKACAIRAIVAIMAFTFARVSAVSNCRIPFAITRSEEPESPSSFKTADRFKPPRLLGRTGAGEDRHLRIGKGFAVGSVLRESFRARADRRGRE
jgi:hypothetical protein